jgi:hypothetical protein
VLNSFQYLKSFEGKDQLLERTCIVGVYNKASYNLYFRCVYEYAELDIYLKNQDASSDSLNKDWLGYKSFMLIIRDNIIKTTSPMITRIERYNYVNQNLNLIDQDLELVFKVPKDQSYFIRLNPDLNSESKFLSVQMRMLDNPFRGFSEYITLADQSMNNVYIRPVIF